MRIDSFKPRSQHTPVILLLCALMAMIFSHNLFAGNLTLAWNASTSSGVTGYKLSYGTASNNYTNTIDVGNVTRFQVTGLPDGATEYFAVKAYSATAESAYSNEVSGAVPTTATPVVVDFTADKTSGTAPAVVNFTGTATTAVTNWSWNFGDGTTGSSSTAGISHTYTTAGTYTVSLTATGAFGTVTGQKASYINISVPPPTANFTADIVSGYAPLTVAFTDTSTGSITSRTWNFGDGTTSSGINPTHDFSAGTYTVSLTVTGSGGSNTVTKTNYIIASIPPSSTPTDQTSLANSLVASYNFDEVGGSLVADASGQGNHGTISGATRSAGRFGNGLTFNGTSSYVTVNDSNSLGLSTGYTLEAWVKPATIKSSNILTKEITNGAVYNLYAYEDADLPAASFNDGSGYRVTSGVNQLPINTWSHLVATYDRQFLRLYVNGVQVASRAFTSLIQQSSGALKIGGNSIWGEYFNGVIDEVRIYNRALSDTEIQDDLNTAIAKANPPEFVVGDNVLESTIGGNPQGTAQAYKATPVKTGVITSFNVYVDASSTATAIVAGIYSDYNGHPKTLLAQGSLSAPKAGATNTLNISAVNLDSAKSYWLALLGKKGSVKFRYRLNSGLAPMETSSSTRLTSLPGTWKTGKTYSNGMISLFGNGY